MTELEVVIVSREAIRPSSPTPPHLRTFKLSLLDQRHAIIYYPVTLYYSSDAIPQTEDASAKLKSSLSEALTRFYPLAGRIKGKFFVDCNDEGVLCLVAKVGCLLSEFLKQPQLDVLGRFLPVQQPIWNGPPEEAVQLAVQINLFSCGGIAIGVSASHKIIDGTTFSEFMKCWAAIARGTCVDKIQRVECLAASLFPPREELMSHDSAVLDSFAEQVESRTSRFVFEAEAIFKLKAKAKSEDVPNPTSTQVLSGFIWKCLTNASKVASGSAMPSALAIAVDLRRRMKPPLPEDTVGNIIWTAFPCYKPPMEILELDLKGFVRLVNNSFSKINSNYVQTLLVNEGSGANSKWVEEGAQVYSNGNRIYAFACLGKLGFNEVDFGWGKPIWISLREITEGKDVLVLIESCRGDGIELWVTLGKDEMSILEHDTELLAFASLNLAMS